MDQLLLLRVATLPFEKVEPLRAGSATPLLEQAMLEEEFLEPENRFLCDALHRLAGPAAGLERQHARARLELLALRRDLFNSREISEDRCDRLRVTLGEQLAGRLERWLERRRRRDGLMRAYHDAFAADSKDALGEAMKIAREPLFEEGLRLTGRSLLGAVRAAASVDPSRMDRLSHDQRHAMAKATAYLGRFTTKTSPNGAFCATALARVADGPGAARVEGECVPLRIDMLLSVPEARKITSCLAASPETQPAVIPRPNPTLRPADGGWTFWRPVTPRRADDDEVLSRVKDHPVLRMFLEQAASQSLSAPALVAEVARLSGLESDDLRGFLADLAERGILLAEVEIPYTSRRPLLHLAGVCRQAGCAAPWLDEIEQIEKEIDRAADGGSIERIEAMNRIESRLNKLPSARALSSDDLFRVDAAAGLRVSIPRRVVDDLRQAMDRYARLFSTMYPQRAHLASWEKRFLSRYPTGTDVELLDLYHGLFEPSRAVERPVSFPAPAGPAAEFFARRARQAVASGQRVVSLTEEDWALLAGSEPAPRWSAGVLFQVAGRDVEAIEAGEYRVVLNALFSGAGLAVARFAHLHGEPIVQALKEQWSAFEPEHSTQPGALLAEVTYMHGGRTANAGLRPPIFSHEIELPGEKASSGAVAIPLSDLSVRHD
ncbi:MAG TPA: lantibiotic dehydratase, partial [Patescibacteria group bacterium]|nr:lantibiotic dehydratase [Patescibacteria group bacterium]